MNEVKAGQKYIHRKNHGGTKDNVRFLKIIAVYKRLSKLKSNDEYDMSHSPYLYYVAMNDVGYSNKVVWGMKMFKSDLEGWKLCKSKKKATPKKRSSKQK